MHVLCLSQSKSRELTLLACTHLREHSQCATPSVRVPSHLYLGAIPYELPWMQCRRAFRNGTLTHTSTSGADRLGSQLR